MIRIVISQAAFEAIVRTLPLGSVGCENKTDEHGQRLIWLDRAVVDRLRALRGPGRELQRCHLADSGVGYGTSATCQKDAWTMNAIDPKIAIKIAALQKQVNAAKEEFYIAITLHETWKPAAYDEDLHGRMGASFATNAFLVVRSALRREMLLALMRLWDRDSRAVRMKESIADVLRDQSVVRALAANRATGMTVAQDRIRQDLSRCASEAIALVDKYSRGGSHYATLEKLRTLRNERLIVKLRSCW
jgi:hypothetical protein